MIYFITFIIVTITPNGETIKGFLIRAGRADPGTDRNTAIGSFAIPTGGTNDYRAECVQNTWVCACHQSNAFKHFTENN